MPRADLVYALFGRANSTELSLWRRTWLQDKPHVFVPDRTEGPWAARYHPVHDDKGAGAMFRFRTDANMLWAVAEANRSYPHARWLFVGDSDAFVFERTLRRRAAASSWREPVAIGLAVNDMPTSSTRNTSVSCPSLAVCERYSGDGNPLDRTPCCACPVSRVDGRWALSREVGTAFYRAPTGYLFGGTGVLLSRGLLNAIDAKAWRQCARRLVCGSADWRLQTCLSNLASSVHYVHMRDNHEFLRAALGDGEAAGSLDANVRLNAFWSTMKIDPTRGERLLAHFRTQTQRCPWSMHKLDLTCVPLVYRASLHCLSLDAAQLQLAARAPAPDPRQCWPDLEWKRRRGAQCAAHRDCKPGWCDDARQCRACTLWSDGDSSASVDGVRPPTC